MRAAPVTFRALDLGVLGLDLEVAADGLDVEAAVSVLHREARAALDLDVAVLDVELGTRPPRRARSRRRGGPER